MNFEKNEVTLPLYNLMIEVTRKCNLKCEHCMRGEPQNIDMSEDVLKEIFRQVKEIYHLSLTGGEPFLAPQVIENMVDVIIDRKIRIHRCTTVDNGTILNDLGIRSINALNRLGKYIYNSVWNDNVRNNPEEKLPISISISNSTYHENDVQKAIDFYKMYANEYVNIDDQGEWETGLKDKQGNILKNKDIKSDSIWLKKEGRAKENNLQSKYISDTYRVKFWMNEEETKAAVETGIQICANGNVVLVEPLSFESMDKKNMGNIMNESLSCMIYKWNWLEPLDYKEVREYCDNLTLLDNPKLSQKKRTELKLKNGYIDTKKLLYVEAHKDYPYMSKDDLNMAVVSKLALITIEQAEDLISEGLTEEDIIEIILKHELIGEYKQRFTKEDLELIIQHIINKHNQEVIKHRGFLGYIKYIANLLTRDDEYYSKLEVSAYEK